MFSDKETCCFMHLLYNALYRNNYYLLPISKSTELKPNKTLLGYYDDEYIYIYPSIITAYADTIMIQAKKPRLNMQKILKNLFALNYIKVHWVLTGEVRYRPQKRVGATRNRYITFYRKQLMSFFTEQLISEVLGR